MSRVLAPLAALALLAAGGAEGAFPGRDGRVVFVSIAQGRGGFGWQALVSVRADGTAMRTLSLGDPDEFVDFAPAWSPDGRRIAFVRSFGAIGGAVGPGTRGSEIYVMGADGRRKRRLTRNRVADGSPSWSPDGRRILFTRRGDLWVTSATGARQRRLTRTAVVERDAAWAPRGGRLAFVTSDGLWTSRADGGGRRRVLAGRVRSPDWSPDARRIAVTTPDGIVVVDADGENARLIAPRLHDAAWSPSGTQLVAAGVVAGFQGIVLLDLDGTTTPVTRDPVPPGAELLIDHNQPDWQPLR